MGRHRTLAAFVLLSAFAVGGLGMPVLHEVVHAGEAAEAMAHRADADHHHHTEEDAHGTEILPPCPDALDADLTCVLCAAASALVALAPDGLAAPERGASDAVVLPEAPPSPAYSAYGARGPPALV